MRAGVGAAGVARLFPRASSGEAASTSAPRAPRRTDRAVYVARCRYRDAADPHRRGSFRHGRRRRHRRRHRNRRRFRGMAARDPPRGRRAPAAAVTATPAAVDATARPAAPSPAWRRSRRGGRPRPIVLGVSDSRITVLCGPCGRLETEISSFSAMPTSSSSRSSSRWAVRLPPRSPGVERARPLRVLRRHIRVRARDHVVAARPRRCWTPSGSPRRWRRRLRAMRRRGRREGGSGGTRPCCSWTRTSRRGARSSGAGEAAACNEEERARTGFSQK